MSRTAKTNPRARVLGTELRQLREAAGLGVRELGRRLGVGHTTVWRYESGVKPPSPEDAASVLTALRVTGAEKERIVKMARHVHDPDWLTSGIPGIREELAALIEFERTATQITDVQVLVFPGMLQTREYMHAVMRTLPPEKVETRVAFRLSRREILDKDDGPHLVALIAEAALRERIGGPEVMADQFRYLLKMSKRDNVTIQILPSGATSWHAAHAGAFILFEFDDQGPIVHLEHFRTSAFLRNLKDVKDYCQAADSLRKEALSETASRELIGDYLKSIEGGLG